MCLYQGAGPRGRRGSARETAHRLTDGIARCRRAQGSPEILRGSATLHTVDDRGLDELGSARNSEMLHHELHREDGAHRIGDILPGVLRSGSMDRLEHRDARRVDVSRRGEAETALNLRAE